MLSFMTTAVQLLFPQFLGAFGGLCVISNVSLETTDCRGRGLVLPLALFQPCEKRGCADRQNTNPEMHTWEICSRKVEGVLPVLSDLLATKLTFNSMSAMNVMWLVFIWFPW